MNFDYENKEKGNIIRDSCLKILLINLKYCIQNGDTLLKCVITDRIQTAWQYFGIGVC